MEGRIELNARERAQISKFLDAHVGHLEADDLGALIGQVALISEMDPIDPSLWASMPEAVSRALAV